MARVVDTNDGVAEPLKQPAKKWSGKCKLCVGCAVFWVVVLAVMIPVSLIKIAPLIGQKAIDMTRFHIKNFTVYGSPGQPTDPGAFNGWVHNEMNLESPIFIGAIVHDVNVTMVINQPPNSTSPSGFTDGPVGWFTQPNSTVTQGDNWMSMDVPVHFNSTADAGWRFSLWAFYAWADGRDSPGGVVYMDLVAEPKLTALGFVTMKTKMKKQIACTCIKDSPNCAFPNLKPAMNMTPNTTFKDDDLYYEPGKDNMTVDPLPYNATHDQTADWFYLPIISLSCEPIDTPVYNGTDIMPIVSTTTTWEFGFAV